MRAAALAVAFSCSLILIQQAGAAPTECDLSLIAERLRDLLPPQPLPSTIANADPVRARNGGWDELDPTPAQRYSPASAYDPIGQRMVVFGGTNGIPSRDLWSVRFVDDEPRWERIFAVGGGPAARSGHTMVYSTANQGMIVYGGSLASGIAADVWFLSLSGTPEWHLVTPSTGPAPAPRFDHVAVYDSARDRMIVFGGQGSTSYFNDVWTFSMQGTPHWTQETPAGIPPAPRAVPSLIVDSARDRAVIYGGFGAQRYADIWSLSLSGQMQWTALPSGPNTPEARSSHKAVYLPGSDAMVVFGGRTNPARVADLLRYDLSGATGWVVLTPNSPIPQGRAAFAASLDPQSSTLAIFGGLSQTGAPLNDAWVLQLEAAAGWRRIPPFGERPRARAAETLTYDPKRDQFLMYGNDFTAEGGLPWTLSLHDGAAWTRLSPTGTPPSTRGQHSMTYDPRRDRFVMFGGVRFDGTEAHSTSDTWALSLTSTGATWTQLLPEGSGPISRASHRAIYDPLRDRIVIFGGANEGDGVTPVWLNEVWELRFSETPLQWRQLNVSGEAPYPRGGHTMIYDPRRDRAIVFGGDYYFGTLQFNDVWSLSFGVTNEWRKLEPLGVSPTPRSGAVAIYDPVRDRMVLSGGADPEPLSESWVLDLSGGPTWEPLSPIGVATGQGAAVRGSGLASSAVSTESKAGLPTGGIDSGDYWPMRDQLVMFGGANEDHLRLNELWGLRWGLDAAPPDSPVIYQALPSRLATGTGVTVSIEGVNIPTGTTAQLLPNFGPALNATRISVEGTNTLALIRFDLEGASIGPATIQLTGPDGQPIGSAQVEVVAEASRPLEVALIGPSQFRSGVERIIYAVAINDGNSDAVGVSMFIGGIPTCASVRLLAPLNEATSSDPGVAALLDSIPSLVMDTTEDQTLCLLISYIPPGSPVIIPIGLTVNCDTPISLQARLFRPAAVATVSNAITSHLSGLRSRTLAKEENCSEDDVLPCVGKWMATKIAGDVLGSLLEPVLPPAPECVDFFSGQIATGFVDQMTAVWNGNDPTPRFESWSKLAVSLIGPALEFTNCAGQTFTGKAKNIAAGIGKAAGKLATGYSYVELADCFLTSICEPDVFSQAKYDAQINASRDPNAKYGSPGASSSRAIGPDGSLNYTIAFENLAAATASAASVRVTDVVDTARVDLNSFCFGPINIGGELIPVPRSGAPFFLTVDLRPRVATIVSIQGELNRLTGEVRWQFQSLDPSSCDPVATDLGGFLPPNHISPEGEGWVSFSVNPRADASHGLRIVNDAGIVFDTNPEIRTNEWANTIDREGPDTHVLQLPAQTPTAAFRVTWLGMDSDAGLQDATIFVSEDGGPYRPWVVHSQTDTTTYIGQVGSTYAFYSIGRDAAGNVEGTPPAPDAITTITPGLVSGSLDTDPNTLNLQSMGKWVTGYVELDAECGAENILVPTVRLNGAVAADVSRWAIADHDSDGVADMALKFRRIDASSILEQGEVVPVTVTGRVWGCPDTLEFAVYDTIRVIRPTVTAPSAGNVLPQRYPFVIRWNPPTGHSIDSVSVLCSPSPAAEWTILSHGLPDAHQFTWATPDTTLDSMFVAVVAYENGGILGVGYAGPVRIANVTGVNESDAPKVLAVYPAWPNPTRGRTEFAFDLPEASNVRLRIYQVTGRLVATLVDGNVPRGRHRVSWSAQNSASGVYFYRFESPGHVKSGRVAVLK